MQDKRTLFEDSQKRTSVVMTVLFIALACLIGYFAMRWMGSAVVRYLSAPKEDVPKQMDILPAEEPVAIQQQEQQLTETPVPVQAAETVKNSLEQSVTIQEQTERKPVRQTETVQEQNAAQETGAWRDGTRYRASFSEDCMDAVLMLADAENRAAAICVLAVRKGTATLVAIPGNVLCENGRTLDSYTANDAVDAVASLLRLDMDRYLILPKSEFAAAIKLLGSLEVAGREMDGELAKAYLQEAEGAPLLYAERFSHVLCALPKAMHTLSVWQLLRLKAALADVVKSNISEEDGWMLCNAIRDAKNMPVEEITLPVESDAVADMRVYRMNPDLTEPIMEKLYKSFEKTS